MALALYRITIDGSPSDILLEAHSTEELVKRLEFDNETNLADILIHMMPDIRSCLGPVVIEENPGPNDSIIRFGKY